MNGQILQHRFDSFSVYERFAHKNKELLQKSKTLGSGKTLYRARAEEVQKFKLLPGLKYSLINNARSPGSSYIISPP